MKPDSIVIHCSASTWGDAETFDSWHKQRGWGRRASDGEVYHIGYHAVILNGRPKYASRYRAVLDGKIEPGRPDDCIGSHCSADGMNGRSLGVVLTGMPRIGGYPTNNQLGALIHYCAKRCEEYGIPVNRIFQHSDFDRRKPYCASLDIEWIREQVSKKLRTI